MGKQIKITRGFDINLIGSAKKTIQSLPNSETVSLRPSDFRNLSPKLLVSEGDEVLVGQKIFFDKNRPEIGIPSPVSGEVVEIVRAEKRRITHVKILADKNTNFKSFPIPSSLDFESVKNLLLDSGCWSYIRQRPFDIIPDPNTLPKSIFVSLFDSAPLAPDFDFILDSKIQELTKGLEILNILAGGKLNVSVKPESKFGSLASAYNFHEVKGPHPAGNVGIQIHHIDPIKIGQTVWYVNAQDVAIIGKLFLTGQYHPQRTIALAGGGVVDPQYFEVNTAQTISSIVKNKILEDNQRIIDGNILTGKTTSENDNLSFYSNQITVITEGNKPEFLGWLLPGFDKLSLSRTYFSWLRSSKTYNLDTNTHGEERAFVVTGQYEKVLPMNIMPVVLLKSILAGDIEKMEALGIHEVSEEDFALCEFVCTSKIDVQNIISKGLELIRAEG
jgi:Na+-transporting NADH:ubiquinone oxidoreductase subunit A